jgi:hypothetical protein
VAHNWLNLAIAVPWSLIPVLVAVLVSPSANAAFYAAWMLSTFLYIVPVHLSTVLFAVAAYDPKAIARKLRFTLRLSLLIGLPGMAVLGLGAHLALSIFGAGYARAATLPLWLLVIGYLPTIPRVHYIAVCRAAGKIPRAAVVLTLFAAVEVTAAAAGGLSDGLVGVSAALLAVLTIEGLVTTPAVVRAAYSRGRHRTVESQAGAPGNSTGDGEPRKIRIGPAESPRGRGGMHYWRGSGQAEAETRNERITPALIDERKRELQEAGIAALLSLARSTASTAPIPIMPARVRGPASVSESAPYLSRSSLSAPEE